MNDKYYFEDIGRTLENVVFKHLWIKGYDIYVGKYNNLEIDFVAQKAG